MERDLDRDDASFARQFAGFNTRCVVFRHDDFPNLFIRELIFPGGHGGVPGAGFRRQSGVDVLVQFERDGTGL